MAPGMELVIAREGGKDEKRFVLRPGVEIRIGRHAASELVVDFDGVSGKHAELFMGPAAGDGASPLMVRDASRNGVGVRPGPTADAKAWADPKAPPAWQRLENGMPRTVELGWQLMVPARSRKESAGKPRQLTQAERTLTIARMTPIVLEDPPKPAPQRLPPKVTLADRKAAAAVQESEAAEREALLRLMEDAPAPASEVLPGGLPVMDPDATGKRKKRKEGKKDKGEDGKKRGKDKERKKHKDKDTAALAGVADVMDEIDQELAFSVGKPKATFAGASAAGVPEEAARTARPKRRARGGEALEGDAAAVMNTPDGATEHMMRVVQKAAGAKADAAAIPGPGQRELHSPRPARRGAAPRLTEASLAAAGVGLPSAGAIESELRSVSPISTPGVQTFQQQVQKPKKKRKVDASPGAGGERRRKKRQK